MPKDGATITRSLKAILHSNHWLNTICILLGGRIRIGSKSKRNQFTVLKGRSGERRKKKKEEEVVEEEEENGEQKERRGEGRRPSFYKTPLGTVLYTQSVSLLLCNENSLPWQRHHYLLIELKQYLLDCSPQYPT